MTMTIEQELQEAKAQIAVLTARVKNLQTKLRMEEIRCEQDMTKLKGDLYEAFRLDIQLQAELEGEPCDQDTFEAYRTMAKRTVKVLRRFGIS